MAKVISLKLTDKEERIINELNEGGISNSELIRDALWHYFRTIDNEVNQKVNLVSPERNDKFFYDYIFRLKNEVSELRQENNKIQNAFHEEIKNIHKFFDEGLPAINLTKNELIPRLENDLFDVHNAIDEFLRKKETK